MFQGVRRRPQSSSSFFRKFASNNVGNPGFRRPKPKDSDSNTANEIFDKYSGASSDRFSGSSSDRFSGSSGDRYSGSSATVTESYSKGNIKHTF